jgi:hypothetical protein
MTEADREKVQRFLKFLKVKQKRNRLTDGEVRESAGVSSRDWHAWQHGKSQPNAGQRRRCFKAASKVSARPAWRKLRGRAPKLGGPERAFIGGSDAPASTLAKVLNVSASTIYAVRRSK